MRDSSCGSSPRVWGTSSLAATGIGAGRFIPTCVGNIGSAPRPSRFASVHPHVCGEHGVSRRPQFCNIGSSPRVWGTSRPFPAFVKIVRFIPTCVGNIPSVTESSSILSVHPHVCGEHPRETEGHQARSGSSPRVWGTFDELNELEKQARFIPTCVGNIYPLSAISKRDAVHPHVCGEHAKHIVVCVQSSGSSPRVWGTCSRCHTLTVSQRFIPTCVGNILLVSL